MCVVAILVVVAAAALLSYPVYNHWADAESARERYVHVARETLDDNFTSLSYGHINYDQYLDVHTRWMTYVNDGGPMP